MTLPSKYEPGYPVARARRSATLESRKAPLRRSSLTFIIS